jgi:hypothetical protein
LSGTFCENLPQGLPLGGVGVGVLLVVVLVDLSAPELLPLGLVELPWPELLVVLLEVVLELELEP